MTPIQRPINKHQSYHAHIYFDQNTVDIATELYEKIQNQFDFKIGQLHKKAVGPHLQWMFYLPFSHSDFELLISYLEDNRKGLSILIHPLTGNDLKDHSEHASWLGAPVPLKL